MTPLFTVLAIIFTGWVISESIEVYFLIQRYRAAKRVNRAIQHLTSLLP